MKQMKRQVTHKAAQAAAAAADTTTTTSPSSQDAAATNEDELEEQMAADAVDEEGAQVKKKVRFAKPVSNVRWSTVRRRRTMPGSEGWSWGGKRDDSTEWFRAQYLRFAGTSFDPNAEANSYLRRARGEAEVARGLA